MLLFYAWTSSYYFWQGDHWAWRMWWSTSIACRRNHQEHLAKDQQTQASSTRQLKNWYPCLWWSRGKRLVVVPKTMAACVSGACSNVALFLMYAGPPVHENGYIHGERRGCCSGPWWCSLSAHTFLCRGEGISGEQSVWPIQKNIQRLPGRGSAALLGWAASHHISNHSSKDVSLIWLVWLL